MRSLYDSTNLNDIPTSAELVAGYIDGIYAAPASAWARFPNARRVFIAVKARTNAGHVLDVETGDATPDEVPYWVRMRRAAGVFPSVYVNRSNYAAVRAALLVAGLRDVPIWLSTLDGSRDWRPGVVAVQHAGERLTGRHYDLSDVLDYWPGVDPAKPATPGGAAMDNDLVNTLRKLAIDAAANAAGLRLTDAELDVYTFNVAPDFHNLREIEARMRADHAGQFIGTTPKAQ